MRKLRFLPAVGSLFLIAALCLMKAQADVQMPAVFSSHMVLQQGKPVVVWGWASAGEKVTIQLGSERQQVQATPRGEWKAALPAMKAGGPLVLTVSSANTLTFEDVMVGEVWLCSGQSNMEMGIGASQNGKEEIAAANHPGLRLLMVPNRWTGQPQTNFEGGWKICTPETVGESGWGGFSAAGYYFGRELNKELGVTVGLIDATWGGTRIESWSPPEGFAGIPALKSIHERVQLGDPRTALHKERLGSVLSETERWLSAARQALTAEVLVPAMPTYPSELLPPGDLQAPTALYNGMIHPLAPLGLAGAIWYQGESNLGEGMLYADKTKALVEGWRKVWNQGAFPFYFVQIAPFNYGGNPEREPELWEAQAAAAENIPNAGMAVINDIGNLKDIHPANKQEVGRRLALLALARTYGKTALEDSGPTFKSFAVEGPKARITFTHAAGLASRDGKPLSWFELIDADEGGFVPAEARIEGASVVLSSPQVKTPVAMRFAWSMLAEPNLVNGAGLPAGAFRAGQVPKRDLLLLKVPEASQYRLVYDLDLNKLGPDIRYTANDCAKIAQPFDRVAYFLELQGNDGDTQYLYVSMDAFTDSLGKIGVPTFASGARFQQPVNNLNVYSNVKGIVNGTGLKGGNIEFWPNNYGTPNAANVPNASGQVYDFGDEQTEPADGYGCMQVHNHDAKQTLFAINHWREGQAADIGLGNQPKNNPDWTFAGNAGSYPAKRLRVFVRCK